MDRIIVALDQMGLDEIDFFLKRKDNPFSFVKIGLELFIKYGPDLIHKIHNDYRKRIFLDLKLHDIPVTVSRAVHSLKNLPIEMLTVHLGGGEKMLVETVREARISIPHCKILGVSFLTSLETKDLQDIYGITEVENAFKRLFLLAQSTGIDGVVCSSHEATLLKKNFKNLIAVTPGIRFEDEIRNVSVQDQKRVATPKEAWAMGADYLVMGRSLTKASNLQERIIDLK